MPAIITNINRIQRTYDFAQKVLYFGIGRLTNWSDETLPPTPAFTSTQIEELNFIAKVENLKYIIPDEEGEIYYINTRWTEIAENDIYAQNCYNLYLDVTLDYDNYPIIDYRQVGLLENPTDIYDEICRQNKYLVNEINSQGILHYLDNRVVTYRQLNQQERISAILEF